MAMVLTVLFFSFSFQKARGQAPVFCNICDCSSTNVCQNTTINCNKGNDCTITCGFEDCENSIINCNDATNCNVYCSGSDSCKNALINCGEVGNCNIHCDNTASCLTATFNGYSADTLNIYGINGGSDVMAGVHINCNNGTECSIICAEPRGCKSLTVNCGNVNNCNTHCSHMESCKYGYIDCGQSDNCNVTCGGDGIESCQYINITAENAKQLFVSTSGLNDVLANASIFCPTLPQSTCIVDCSGGGQRECEYLNINAKYSHNMYLVCGGDELDMCHGVSLWCPDIGDCHIEGYPSTDGMINMDIYSLYGEAGLNISGVTSTSIGTLYCGLGYAQTCSITQESAGYLGCVAKCDLSFPPTNNPTMTTNNPTITTNNPTMTTIIQPSTIIATITTNNPSHSATNVLITADSTTYSATNDMDLSSTTYSSLGDTDQSDITIGVLIGIGVFLILCIIMIVIYVSRRVKTENAWREKTENAYNNTHTSNDLMNEPGVPQYTNKSDNMNANNEIEGRLELQQVSSITEGGNNEIIGNQENDANIAADEFIVGDDMNYTKGGDVDGEVLIENEVYSWLARKCELQQYYNNFVENGYEKLSYIKEIQSKDELEKIGIPLTGHQTKIFAEIRMLQNIQTDSGMETNGTSM